MSDQDLTKEPSDKVLHRIRVLLLGCPISPIGDEAKQVEALIRQYQAQVENAKALFDERQRMARILNEKQNQLIRFVDTIAKKDHELAAIKAADAFNRRWIEDTKRALARFAVKYKCSEKLTDSSHLEAIGRRIAELRAMEAGRNREAARLRKDLAAAIQRAESAESWAKSWLSDVNDCAAVLALTGQPMIPGCMKNAAEQLRDERDRAQAEVAQVKRDMQTREDQHWAEHNRISKERDDFRESGLKLRELYT